MKKLFIIVVTIAAVSLFFVFEKGEKPLSSAQMIQRLNQAGFEVLPQEKLLLYPDQEALFPETPEIIQTMRLRHTSGNSTVVTAASFSNETIPSSLKGKTRGFPSRNWFFFGGTDTMLTKKIQEALQAEDGDLAYRVKISETTNKQTLLIHSTQNENLKAESKEEVLSREEILGRFRAAGLTINRIVEDKGMPGSVKRKLPVTIKPRDDFLLFIENEGVFPIEFNTPADAIEMHRKYKKGFRHGNWYFPGQITSELREKLVRALKNNQEV